MYSVVVPTYNRASLLARTLESLLTQEADLPYEIIVVDNNSADETRFIVQCFERRTPSKVRYVFEGRQGLSTARNAGIEAARGEFLAFIDDDEIAQPQWLRALARTYQMHPDAWCVGGKVTLRLPELGPSWFDPASKAMSTYLGLMDRGEQTIRIEPPSVVIGGNLSVRRATLSRVGLFNTELGRVDVGLLCGEDLEMCFRIQRAGGSIYYCGQAVVIHLVPTSRITKRYFRKRAYWQGRTEGLLLPTEDRDSSWRKLGGEAIVVAKDWAKALIHYGIGRRCEAFELELGTWKRLGYLHQHLRLGRTATSAENVARIGPNAS